MNGKQKAENFKEKYKGKVQTAMQKRKERKANGEDPKGKPEGDEKNMSKREKFLEMIKEKKAAKK